MKLQELASTEKEFLIPRQVAEVLGCSAYTINIMARDAPESLGFPVIRLGTRVKIPKKPFLKFMGWEDKENV